MKKKAAERLQQAGVRAYQTLLRLEAIYTQCSALCDNDPLVRGLMQSVEDAVTLQRQAVTEITGRAVETDTEGVSYGEICLVMVRAT